MAGPPLWLGELPPTGVTKCPPPLVVVVWLVLGVPEPVVLTGVEGVDVGAELAGVLDVEPALLLPAGVDGGDCVPVPNAPLPRYGALPLLDCAAGVGGCAGVTPTGATWASGFVAGFEPPRPVRESGCRTSTRVVAAVLLSWRVLGAALTDRAAPCTADDTRTDAAERVLDTAEGRAAATRGAAGRGAAATR